MQLTAHFPTKPDPYNQFAEYQECRDRNIHKKHAYIAELSNPYCERINITLYFNA